MKTDQSIKDRKTQKVLANTKWETKEKNIQTTIDELVDLAAYAPFHLKKNKAYDYKDLNGQVPWRFYNLDTVSCRKLSDWIQEHKIPAGKIINMLFAADALLLVTWLPEPNGMGEPAEKNIVEPIPFNGNLANMEHIAATSAAIQNVLIGAAARDIPSYWSTGGALRQAPIRNKLAIALDEILLGAIFLFPKNLEDKDGEVMPGKLHRLSKDKITWSRQLSI